MQVFWLTQFAYGRLAIMTRPRGGEWLPDDIGTLAKEGVKGVVSCLTAPEEIELELKLERTECERAGIKFFSFPIDDRGLPSSKDSVAKLALELDSFLSGGSAVAVHCRQGIGRSSMICATLMVSKGIPATTAFGWLTEARGRPLPDTDEQRAWVSHFELDFLGGSKAT